MDRNCAVVSIFGYKRNLPCLWLSDTFNRWFGAKRITPPSIGTEVAVICSNDSKYGVIVGTLNATGEWADKPAENIFATPVDREQDTEAHKSKDWGFGSFLIDGSDGVPLDALPGDDITINAQGALSAVLELLTMIRGGNAASIETFVFDQLTRITGYNLQERTSLYDRNVMEDHGFVSEDESGSHILDETLGNGLPDDTEEENMGSARRFQNLRGWLGGLVQKFILRPDMSPVKMDEAADKNDLGLYQRYEHLSGLVLERSLTGGGIIKGMSIPVPKKKKEADNPSGNSDKIKNDPIKEFKFSSSPGTPASAGCQTRDFLAYLFNKVAAARLSEMDKDWDVPDEATCPTLNDQSNPPGAGGFYREFPNEVDAMKDSSNGSVMSDKSGVMKTRQGTAWCMVLPDGSVSIRDIWGSQIEMRGGHIDISASKDIRLSAGGSVVVLGGDDCIIKGRKSVDITATEQQVRIRSQREMFIHAEGGGMLISLGSAGQKFAKKDGEERALPGICIKVPDKGGVTINAGQLTCNLSDALFINEDGEGNFPKIWGKISGCYLKVEGGGGVAYQFDNGGIEMTQEGLIYCSGDIWSEGNIAIKGDATFGSEPTYPSNWDDTDSVEDLLKDTFDDIDELQNQFKLEELKDNYFVFRTVDNYATKGGAWFESFWQREMDSTSEWKERPDKDGQFPYPGKDHYNGGRSFWKYSESNVDKVGKSKSRDSLSSSPSGFNATDWNSFPVHTDR